MAIELSLVGKAALITGGSRGIGAAAVRMFAAAGARVVFSYQRAREQAVRLEEQCGGGRCVAVQADLDSAGAAQALVSAAVERLGRLDILVANHGIWPSCDRAIDRMPEEQWRQTIAINLESVFGLVKHSVVEMKKHGAGGSIVLISSTAGQRGEAFHTDYAATKGAIISMVKGLSTELAPEGIRVNCVAPGWVATDMSAPVMADGEYKKRVFAAIPLGRIGTPEEIAAPILFLCTPHAGFITGEVFNVNGGAVLVG
ncbi:MAG: SDR family oxidoreductase [Acidobacteria bacterium]|nr:SDR family oxidoreductase [Acidobacteriota bacterium]